MWNHTGNIVLHKDDVGKPKPPAVRLPPNDYVYGNHNRLPEDGVKELIHQWKYHHPTKDQIGPLDFTKMNKSALQHGVYTSSGFRNVSQGNMKRIKPYKGKMELDLCIPDSDFYYGVPNRPSTPVKKVINNDYGNESEKIMVNNYANMMAIASQKIKFTPAQTKAANLNREINNMKLKQRELDPIEKQKSMYKMKKFTAVGSRVNTNRKPFNIKDLSRQGAQDAEGQQQDVEPQAQE